MTLKHLRSSTANKRPQPSGMADGQLAMNTASGSPGLFLKDANGGLVKIGPVHVGSTAPNASPASGGTSGNSIGEQWLDNSGGTYIFKVWDGSEWRSESGEFVNASGDTMTGSLTMGTSANIIFEGSVDDGFETTLTVTNPTADRTITLPNVTGTVITTGDSGTVTSTMIADSTIVNADVSASAAIAGTKISPNFGSQNTTTTGTSTAASFIPTSSGVPTNGLYLSSANSVAISANSAGRLFVDSSGRVGIGASLISSPLDDLHISSSDPGIIWEETDAGVDEKRWRVRAEGSILRFEGVNDAFNASQSWLNVTRTTAARTIDNIAFITETTERLRITSDGKLGLGTSSPNERFSVDVNGTTNRAIEIYNGDTTLNDGEVVHAIRFTQNDTSSPNTTHASIETVTTGSTGLLNMVFKARDNTEYMRIKSSGVINFSNAPVYADNAAAKTGGLVDGDIYRTSTGDLKIVYT